MALLTFVIAWIRNDKLKYWKSLKYFLIRTWQINKKKWKVIKLIIKNLKRGSKKFFAIIRRIIII